MLGEIKPKLLQLLPEAHKQTSSNYVSDFDLIAGQLRSLVYRAMCPDLIKQQEVSPPASSYPVGVCALISTCLRRYCKY